MEVVNALQELYPMLLASAPAFGRKCKFIVNGKEVPKPDRLDKKVSRESDIKRLKVAERRSEAYFNISDEDLEEGLRGVAIVVCGRN